MSEQRFSLDTFDVERFRFQNIGKTVHSKGTGPGVVVLAAQLVRGRWSCSYFRVHH